MAMERRSGGAAVGTGVSPVSSHNEWDPLEEIIVGRLDEATIPSRHPVVSCNIPPWAARLQGVASGRTYPRRLVGPAQRELDRLITLLRSLGITVTRPDAVDHRRRFATPDWSSRGFCNTCPRDSMLVIGDEIIETPMAWPCRYFETHSYRALLKDYFRRGARWTAAPKPQLTDELFEKEFRTPGADEPMRYILTEFEPVFDAADFVRAGRDLFVTRSNVTNAMGIEWLRRHLGPGYRIHEIESRCRTPMHIDTTFLPLAPGDVAVRPMAQHERSHGRREAGQRRAAPHRHAAGARTLGLRADPGRSDALRAVRRLLPLRDARCAAARDAGVLLRLILPAVPSPGGSPDRLQRARPRVTPRPTRTEPIDRFSAF